MKRINGRRRSGSGMCPALTAALAFAVSPALLADSAHAPNDGHGWSVAPGGRFTPNADGAVFPPQPAGISDVRELPRARTAASGQAIAETARRDPAVRAAIGERHALIGTHTVTDKRGGAARQQAVWYSHSLDHTVTATVENGRVTALQSDADPRNAPPLGESEQAEAIAIARADWLGQGHSEVSGLVGYAIQAFPPGGGVFEHRVAYVSWHEGSPEAPLLTSWVDLHSGEVFDAEASR